MEVAGYSEDLDNDEDGVVDESDFGYVPQDRENQPEKKTSTEEAASMNTRNRNEKLKLVSQFLSMRYPLDHGFENQEALKQVVTTVIPDLERALADEILEKNADAAMWSDRNFNAELDAVVGQVERVVF